MFSAGSSLIAFDYGSGLKNTRLTGEIIVTTGFAEILM